jgi:hypothetical protein
MGLRKQAHFFVATYRQTATPPKACYPENIRCVWNCRRTAVSDACSVIWIWKVNAMKAAKYLLLTGVLSAGVAAGCAFGACSISPSVAVIPKGHVAVLVVHCDNNELFKKIDWQRSSDGGASWVSGLRGGVTLTGAERGGDFVYQTWNQLPEGTHTYRMSGVLDDGNNTPAPNLDTVVYVKAVTAETGTTGLCGVANGALTPASTVPTASMLGTNALCTTGATAGAVLTTDKAAFTWNCTYGSGSQSCRAPKSYTATFIYSTGSVDGVTTSPKTYHVEYGRTQTVALAPPAQNPGYLPVIGPNSCPGVFSNYTNGNGTGSWTLGPVTGACNVNLSFESVIQGACNPNTIGQTWTSSPPIGAACTTGTLHANNIADIGTSYQWICDGSNGGSSPTCNAPKGYLVQYDGDGIPSGGGSGSITPILPTGASPLTVRAGTSATFTIAPGATTLGTGMVTGAGCSGSPATGSPSSFTYTVTPTAGPCAVTATFNKAGDPGLLGDAHKEDVWLPPGVAYDSVTHQPDLLVVGPTYSAGVASGVSYLPGCSSSIFPGSSGAGCAGKDYYEGTTSDNATPVKFYFKQGKVLSVRFISTGSRTGQDIFQPSAADGGTATNLKMWMTTNYAETYAEALARDPLCAASTANYDAVLVNGVGGCAVPAAGTLVYFNMEVIDGKIAGCGLGGQYCRYQIDLPLLFVR